MRLPHMINGHQIWAENYEEARGKALILSGLRQPAERSNGLIPVIVAAVLIVAALALVVANADAIDNWPYNVECRK